jgi:hypothetical protein
MCLAEWILSARASALVCPPQALYISVHGFYFFITRRSRASWSQLTHTSAHLLCICSGLRLIFSDATNWFTFQQVRLTCSDAVVWFMFQQVLFNWCSLLFIFCLLPHVSCFLSLAKILFPVSCMSSIRLHTGYLQGCHIGRPEAYGWAKRAGGRACPGES